MKKRDRYEITTNDYGMFITDRKTQDIYTNTNVDDFKKLRVLLNYQDQKIDNLKRQLTLTEKALTLAREYMFNVMCADDVPTEHWFVTCAENNWKPS